MAMLDAMGCPHDKKSNRLNKDLRNSNESARQIVNLIVITNRGRGRLEVPYSEAVTDIHGSYEHGQLVS